MITGIFVITGALVTTEALMITEAVVITKSCRTARADTFLRAAAQTAEVFFARRHGHLETTRRS